MPQKQIYTSSTPQGGGGSFKDRKPLRKVSCCDAWMPERNYGLKDCWSCAFLEWLQWSPHPQLRM